MTATGLQLPPGFRFHPTDEELVMLYLCRKCASQPIAAPIISINDNNLDDWVLCRIYNKRGSIEKQPPQARFDEIVDKKPDIAALAMDTCRPPMAPTGTINDVVYFDTSESVPKVHTDSSCSEHAVSPEFTCEVQSEPKRKDWQSSSSNTANTPPPLDFPYHYMDATVDTGFTSEFHSSNQLSLLQDMFMYPQKPF